MNASTLLTKIFGSRNDRLVKRYRRIVALINEMEPKVSLLTDAQLRARTLEIRQQIAAGKLTIREVLPEAMAIIRESMDRHIGIRNILNPEFNFNPELFPKGECDDAYNAYGQIEDQMIQGLADWAKIAIPNSIYAAVRKVYPDSRPPFRARCFDVQLIGGLVLYEGKIAEMKTGEGKTFVAPLACFLKVLEGKHAHVVTVNDYLVKRDSQWVKPAFDNLGISVGYIQSDLDPGGDGRRKAYECDITYGTNSEFGFDYLRDNMRERVDLQVQGPLDFAIVDEVDSILIDEARTPLIISGMAHDNAPRYRDADKVARRIMELHKPASVIEREILQAKREVKAAEGEIDKAEGKDNKSAAQKRLDEATKRLADAEAKKTGVTFYYEVEYDKKSVHLTHEGIASAQEIAGVGSFYVGDNMDWPHLMEQALRAHVVFERDRDYVVEKGTGPRSSGQMEVVIVDEYTGRKMVGRQWSDGLHQAIEAKEGVPIKQETQTVATITLQNFFKLYGQIGGMTGTAQTEAEEFAKIYKLEVVTIPTNRNVIRDDTEDRVYRTEQEKWEAMIEEVRVHHEAGRPVLVGTTSVEKSEKLSAMLTKKYGIKHEVLNAKQHEREALIVSLAGQTHKNSRGETVGNVTIATNMAGRGTDIKLAPETQWELVESKSHPAEKSLKVYTLKQGANGTAEVVDPSDPKRTALQLDKPSKLVGGLHVIGTERHTSRRIDNQLRGRSGRQGDPGSSRFYCSLEDDLLKMFMPEWTINVFKKIGMQYGEAIESGMLSRSIEKAQKKVEERNFLARKNLLEYDEVMDVQRSEFYGMRQQILEGRDIDQVIWKMIDESIADAVDKYVTQDFVSANIAEWARNTFDVSFEIGDFKGIRRLNDLEELIKSIARNEVVHVIPTTLGEYMGEDRNDNSQWHHKDLAAWGRAKFGADLSEPKLRQMTAPEVEQALQQAAFEKVAATDCSPLTQFLEPHFALDALCDWAEDKFGVDVGPNELLLDAGRNIVKPAEEIVEIIAKRAREAYRDREVQYPIDYLMQVAFTPQPGAPVEPAALSSETYRCEYVAQWVRAKYGIDLPVAQIQGKPLAEIRARVMELQKQALDDQWIAQQADRLMEGNPSLDELARRWTARFGAKVEAKNFDPATAATRKGRREIDRDADGTVTTRDILLRRVKQVVRYELTSLEQYVLISIFDQAWKDHLYAMDILKSGIGLQGFAERDPRIAYKREGYRYFREMMMSIRDKVTAIIFRVNVDGKQQPAARSNYKVTGTTHDTGTSYDVGENTRETGGVAETTESAVATEAPPRVQTIKRDASKVGRNDPCPCGSGKKFKKCCGQTASV
jgi:preprotein translocase subunit SecA